MRKFDITKNETVFFQAERKPAFSKGARLPLLLLLCLIAIAGSAFVRAGIDKAKPGTGKSKGTNLPPGPPTLSYPGPHTYLQGQKVLLAPTSSGVAAFGYSSTATPYGSGFYDPVGMATDAAGNLYVADYGNTLIKIPAGNGTPVNIWAPFYQFGSPYQVAIDAAGNLFVATSTPEINESGNPDGYAYEYLYKLTPGSTQPQFIEGNSSYADQYSLPYTGYFLAMDRTGNLFIGDFAGYGQYSDPPALYNVEELPVGNSSTHVVYANYMNVEAMASDASGNLFVSNYPGGVNHYDYLAGIKEIPAGSSSPVSIPGSYPSAVGIALDAADNLFSIDAQTNQLTMTAAGNPYGAQVNIAGYPATYGHGIAIDGAGNIYVSNYDFYVTTPGTVSQLKPTGGYFISPALPAGLQFDSNTGIISGRPTGSAGAATTYTITAYNGSASTSTTVSIQIAPGSNNANLTHLIPTRGVFSPAFSAATTSYSASVAYGVRSFQLTPIAASPDATVTINGTAIADSATSAPLALKPGINTFNIVVTAPDQVTTKTYSLIVTRPVSNNDDLVSITRSAGTISPVFSEATTSYTSNVANGVRTMTITPTASDQDAQIKVNGTVVASGAASAPIHLQVGLNTITIAVTATNGTTNKTYTIKVTRPASADDNLSGLSVNAGTLLPIFNAAQTNYTVNVANSVQYIAVVPVALDPDATIKVNGTSVSSGGTFYLNPLPIGSSSILITVTASNKTTSKTYVITVNRPPSNNANLAYFVYTGGTLSPDFSPSITNYNATVNYGQTSLMINTTVANPEATLTINGKPAASGQSSAPIALHVGANTIRMVVTAGDKITSKTYTITETRLPPSNNADLNYLYISQGTISPAFSPSITNYTASVLYAQSPITVGQSAVDPYATVNINGTDYLSGRTVSPIALSVGANPINFTVTATDGVTTKTYTLTVTRLPASNNAGLSNLTIGSGDLSPRFTTANTDYTVTLPSSTSSISITPTAAFSASKLTINGIAATSGVSKTFSLAVGSNTIATVVTAEDGTTTNTYTVLVYRLSPTVNIPVESLSVNGQLEKPTIEDDAITVHQGLSPNGDGINDYLVIDGIQACPDNKLTIMNRNGELVFEAKGYDNTNKTFDGHSSKNGKMQLPGTYFYSLDYTFKGVIKRKTGFIILKY